MPVLRYTYGQGGLALGLPPESLPNGFWRRYKGVHNNPAGRVRSRNGLALISALSDPHSLYRFDDKRYVGDGTTLKKSGSNEKTGLDGTRLAFVSMQTGLGIEDYLFIAGGGELFKLSKGGAQSEWGRTKPLITFATATVGDNIFWPAGDYRGTLTWYSSTTGYESNPGDIETITLDGTTHDRFRWTINPDNRVLDSYFDTLRAYVSLTDGSDLFLLTSNTADAINYSFTSTDPASEVDFDEPLLFDNDAPEDTYEDVVGPHVGRLWWGRVDADGERGRVYFSPIGRPEAVQGFLELTADDDEVQKLAIWGDQLFVFTQKSIFRIDGLSDNFAFVRIPGSLGTTAPFSVTPTTFGILYMAEDGVRLFDGGRSELIGFDGLGPLFRGETVDGYHSPFEGLYGGAFRDEYFISDGNRTFAINMRGSWREVGFKAQAFYYEDETDVLVIGHPNGSTYEAEKEETFDDDGDPIEFELETPTVRTEDVPERFLKKIRLDANLRGQDIDVTLIADGVERTVKTIRGEHGRRYYSLPVNTSADSVAVRLYSRCLRQLEVFSIDLHIR